MSLLLACAGCGNSADADAGARIAELEARVAALEIRNQDLTRKGRIVAKSLFGSPLQNFFDSDEFWENTYDSGQADCARRCTETLQTEMSACAAIVDCAQRQQCMEEAIARASNCQTQCSKNNPPPIP